jgi:glycine hydroxymethyltransferase
MGTIEVTRLGMGEAEMEQIADFMARVIVEQESPVEVAQDVMVFRQHYQTLYYCLDHGLPPGMSD